MREAKEEKMLKWYVDVFTIENELIDASGGEDEEKESRVGLTIGGEQWKQSETQFECKLKSRRIIFYNI